MEEKANKKANSSTSSLKHRFAQMLLGSSCTTTATTTSAAKLVKLSSPVPQAHEPPEVHSDCGRDKRLTQHRRKATASPTVAGAYGNCFTPRVAPAAQVPLGCAAGARHSIHTSEPVASRAPVVETSGGKKGRRLTEGAEFYEAFSREEKNLSAALFSSRTPMHLSHRSHREEEAKSKHKNASGKRCKANRKETVKLSSNAYGFSSSSSFDSGHDLGLYTSDEEEEEEESPCTLFSSRSFSSDSSEFYQRNRKKKNNNNHSTNKKNKNRCANVKSTRPSPSPRPPRGATKPRSHSWDAGDKFRPLVSYSSSNAQKRAEAAAPETKATAAAGLAVVKRSSDPYKDFRSSMVEMIVERNISSAEDLEELLQSYLSLNAARHHPVIVDAFSDIWNAIFCRLD